jgi:hypothetical protein
MLLLKKNATYIFIKIYGIKGYKGDPEFRGGGGGLKVTQDQSGVGFSSLLF